MRTKLFAALTLALLTLPAAASAQIGIGGRVGSTGLGADLGLGLSPGLMLRGGIGIQPVNPSATLSGIDFELNLPSSFIQGGIELFPGGGGFRIAGGILYKPDDITMSGTFNSDQQIGNAHYTPAQIGTITGTATSARSMAPYGMIGFGRIASKGIGLYLDLGAAFVGEYTLTVTSNGQYKTNATFMADLDRQKAKWEDDLNKYKIYPMVNLGLRIGF